MPHGAADRSFSVIAKSHEEKERIGNLRQAVYSTVNNMRRAEETMSETSNEEIRRNLAEKTAAARRRFPKCARAFRPMKKKPGDAARKIFSAQLLAVPFLFPHGPQKAREKQANRQTKGRCFRTGPRPLYMTLVGKIASSIPIASAPSSAPIMETYMLGTRNCARYRITAEIKNPFSPFPNGEASTFITASTR